MTNILPTYYDFLKSNDGKSIFSNPNIRQIIDIIAGNEKIKDFHFANKEQSEMARVYMRMYFSLAIVRWCRGEELGVARQKAMEQMDKFMQSRANSQNPSDKYLMDFKKQFHSHIAEINMNDKQNAKRHINAESAKNIYNIFAKELENNMKKLNELSQDKMIQSMIGAQSVDNKKPQQLTPQQTQQMINKLIMEQLMRQRAA